MHFKITTKQFLYLTIRKQSKMTALVSVLQLLTGIWISTFAFLVINASAWSLLTVF